MTGSIQVPQHMGRTPYYVAADFDARFGGEFYLILLPFMGEEDRRFYYIQEVGNGKFEIMGEGYIVTQQNRLAQLKREAAKELGKRPIWYYWLDKDQQIIKQEQCKRRK